jgi:hypothetical protein
MFTAGNSYTQFSKLSPRKFAFMLFFNNFTNGRNRTAIASAVGRKQRREVELSGGREAAEAGDKRGEG